MTLPPRPPVCHIKTSCIPPSLKEEKRWVLWHFDLRQEKGKWKWSKPPYKAKSTDPKSWRTFDDVFWDGWCHYKQKKLSGLGFVLGDGFAGIDLDHCRDPETGVIKPDAAAIIESFKGTYSEISPSQTGVKILLRGVKPLGNCRKTLPDGTRIEVYDVARYFTVTGHRLPGCAPEVADCQEQLDDLCRKLWGEVQASKPASPCSAAASGTCNLADAELLDKARRAKNGSKFTALFDRGDLSGHGDNHSKADLALCCLLAFWCDRDAGRMDSLFRQSALYRSKWDRRDYATRTIAKAIAGCRESYSELLARRRAERTDRAIRLCGSAETYLVGSDGASMEPAETIETICLEVLFDFSLRLLGAPATTDDIEQKHLRFPATRCTCGHNYAFANEKGDDWDVRFCRNHNYILCPGCLNLARMEGLEDFATVAKKVYSAELALVEPYLVPRDHFETETARLNDNKAKMIAEDGVAADLLGYKAISLGEQWMVFSNITRAHKGRRTLPLREAMELATAGYSEAKIDERRQRLDTQSANWVPVKEEKKSSGDGKRLIGFLAANIAYVKKAVAQRGLQINQHNFDGNTVVHDDGRREVVEGVQRGLITMVSWRPDGDISLLFDIGFRPLKRRTAARSLPYDSKPVYYGPRMVQAGSGIRVDSEVPGSFSVEDCLTPFDEGFEPDPGG
jgi:putative DNA primase/helicase